jgi:hypothetical protein
LETLFVLGKLLSGRLARSLGTRIERSLLLGRRWKPSRMIAAIDAVIVPRSLLTAKPRGDLFTPSRQPSLQFALDLRVDLGVDLRIHFGFIHAPLLYRTPPPP